MSTSLSTICLHFIFDVLRYQVISLPTIVRIDGTSGEEVERLKIVTEDKLKDMVQKVCA